MAGKVYEIGFKIAGQIASGFTSTFSKASSHVTGFKKEISELNAKAAALDGVVKQRKAVGEAAREYLKAKQKVAELGKALSKNSAPTNKQIAEFNKAKQASERAKNALDKQRQSLQQLERRTGTAGTSLQTLTRRQKELATATDRARKAAERQEKARGAWDSNMQNVSGNAAYASMTGAAASAGFMATVNIGKDFEQSMSRVGAISRATDAELAKLTEQARQLGSDTVWSATQAAEGMQYLSMAGFSTEQILKTMPGMLSLASAGAIELGAAADISSNILTGFGLKAEDMARVGDVLTNTFTTSNTSLEGLGYTMKYAAPIAKSMGMSIEEAAAMAAKLGDAGIQGEMAGTTLRAVMLRLATPSKEAAKYLDTLGVKTTDAAGNMRPFQDVLADLNKAMSGYSEEARANITKAIFETEAMSGAMVLMEQAGTGSLQKYTESLKQTGTANAVAKKQTDNLAGDMENLSGSIEEVGLTVYDSIKPALREMTQGLAKVVDKVQVWMKQNPQLTKVLALSAGAIGAITAAALPVVAVVKTMSFVYGLLKMPILAVNLGLAAQRTQLIASKVAMVAHKGALLLWRGAMVAVSATLKIMRVAMAALNLVMRANPIGIVITLLGALVAAGVYVYKNWDTIKAKAIELWNKFSETFPGLAEFVTRAFNRTMEIVNAAKAVFSNLIDFVKNVFTGQWGEAWTNVQNIFKNAFEGLILLAKAPLNNLIDMVNIVLGKIGSISIDVPSWVPGVGGEKFGFSIPKIPQLATGGIATRSTIANIGEGSEPEAVLPLSRLDNMLSNAKKPSAESNTISVNFAPVINVNGGSPDAYADIKKALAEGQNNLKKELDKLLSNQRRLSYY
jgi:TP901 family phage tail tape measure protein